MTSRRFLYTERILLLNLLFCLNENYISPLKVMLYSLMDHHQEKTLNVYLMYTDISTASLQELDQLLASQGHRFHPVDCSEYLKDFKNKNFDLEQFKVNRYYSLDMYLWLFAPYLLPKHVNRILYLDSDMVCVKPVKKLYHLDFKEQWFVAASYDFKNNWIQPINNLRLGNLTSEKYFNTGMVLMNLASLRQETHAEEILEAIIRKEKVLYLPDQDIFNYLYEGKTGQVPWQYYNLDPRPFTLLTRLFPNEYNPSWIKEHVVIIHYCGKHKPWIYRDKYRYTLGNHWFDYEEKLLRYEASAAKKLANF